MKFRHLQDINQTYLEHLKDSLWYSLFSLRACIVFLIHGIYPDIFETEGSDTIFHISGMIHEKYNKNKYN